MTAKFNYVIFDASSIDEKYFSKNTKDWLIKIKQESNQNVKHWIIHYLERYLLSAAFTFSNENSVHKGYILPEKFKKVKLDPSDKPVYCVNLSNNDKVKFNNVINYLNIVYLNKEIKLDVETAIKKYRQYIKIEGQKVELYLKCDNNYDWYKLLNKKALQVEGMLMQNCLGSIQEDITRINHIQQVLSGESNVFSLRSKNGNPHVDVKVNTRNKTIVAIYGKQNKFPNKKYMSYVIQLLDSLNYQIDKKYLATLSVQELKELLA